MDWQVQLLGQGRNAPKGPVADGVGRVRRHTERQERLAADAVAELEAAPQVILRVRRVSARELDRDQPEARTHPGIDERARRGFREEVHVVRAGDTTPKHLGAGEQRAVVDEVGRDVLHLRRPDVLPQPGHQWPVVRQAAHERHRGVGMQVHQAGNERVFGQARAFRGHERRRGLCGGEHGSDAAAIDHDAVVGERRALGLHREDPAGVDDEVDAMRRHGAGKKTPRARARGVRGWSGAEAIGRCPRP